MSEVQIYKPIASTAQVVEAHDQFRKLVENALTPGVDYGTLPGTNRPILLKPGAERLLLAAGLCVGEIEIVEQTVDPFCEVEWTKRRWDEGSRQRVAVSGRSNGYWRFVARVGILERATGNRVGDGLGSCSSMEEKYIENPRDTEHTGLSMAVKRAIVSATQRTLGLSGLFGDEDESSNGLHPKRRKAARSEPPRAAPEPDNPPAGQKSQISQRLDAHLAAMGYDQNGIARVLNAAIAALGKPSTPGAIMACSTREQVEALIAERSA